MTIFNEKSSHLLDLKRMRIGESRNLDTGLRLNRNERVAPWPERFITDVFSNIPGYFLSVYPDLSSFYGKLAKFIGVDEDQLLVTSGIDGAIKTIFEICSVPSDRIGVLAPTYAMYNVYSKIFGTKLCEISYDPKTLKLDWDGLVDLIKSKPKVVFIPNPNQPVEDNLTLSQIEELLKFSSATDTLIVIDEAYYHFGCQSAVELLPKYDNLVVMRTFSKGFGLPSIRMGYMISNTHTMEVLSKTRFAHEANALNAKVAEYAIDNFHLVQTYIDEVVSSRIGLQAKLEAIGLKSYGYDANYLLIDLLNPRICAELAKRLLGEDVYVKSNFEEPWSQYMLITVGPADMMEKFYMITKCFMKENVDKELVG